MSRRDSSMPRPVHLLALAALLLAAAAPARAQDASPPGLWLIAKSDSVLILIADPPPGHAGFVVYRGAPGASPVLITEEPVFTERQPAIVVALLDEDLPRVMAALETEDPVTLMRRLQADPVTAALMSALYRGAAIALGRFYADTGLAPGTTYQYRIVFIDAAGEETRDERGGVVRVADVTPGTPTALAGEGGNNEVELSWHYPAFAGDPGDLVLAFHVYRADGPAGQFERVSERPVLRLAGGATRYVDASVSNGQLYRYHVRALDLAGRLGAPGTAVSVTPFDPRPPASPEQLVTEAGEASVQLHWRISPEPAVTGYAVERSTGLDQPYIRLTRAPVPLAEPSFLDGTAVGGTQYFYRIVAVTDHGVESRPGNAISALPYDRTPPEPPADVAAEPAGRQLRIRWAPSPSDDVIGYYIYRGDAPDRVVRLTPSPVEGAQFTDTGFDGNGLNPGRHYTVRVSAVDRSFNESEPIEVQASIPDDEAPDPPTAVHADNVRGRHIDVRWSASPSLDVAHYLVSRSGADARFVDIAAIPADARMAYRDSAGLARGTTYRYRVVAVDAAGNRSGPTDVSVAFRDVLPPPTPRHAAARSTDAGVRITWERVVHPELLGYRVFRSGLATGVYAPVSDLVAPDAELSFIDRDGTPQHYYTVRAVDRSGNESRPGPAVRGEP